MTDARTFANSVGSIARARRFAVDALPDVEPEVIDAVAVMVSELATNAVRHAASDFSVSVECDTDVIRVAVADAGARLPSRRPPEPGEHSGRGLQIVRALADELGVSENVAGPGKTVWFVLAARAARRHSAGSSAASPAPAPAPARRPDSGSAPTGRASRGGRSPRGRDAQASAHTRRSCHHGDARVRCARELETVTMRVQRRRDAQPRSFR